VRPPRSGSSSRSRRRPADLRRVTPARLIEPDVEPTYRRAVTAGPAGARARRDCSSTSSHGPVV
jgi:hypothetical protein